MTPKSKTTVLTTLLLCLFLLLCNNAWAAPKPEIFPQLGHTHWVKSVAFSPDGRYALSGSADKTLKLWEVATGKEIRTFKGHSNFVDSVAYSPDGRYVLSGSWDKTLKLWNVSTGQEIRSFKGHSECVRSVAFSPDGRYALSGSDDNSLKLWEVATGKEIRTFKGHSASVNPVAFSPDGRYVLSKSYHPTTMKVWDMKVWDVATGKEIQSFKGHDFAGTLAFNADGRYALSGIRDKTLNFWDVVTGKIIRSFKPIKLYFSMASSPDGRYALFNGSDNTLRLWVVATGKEIRTFKGHDNIVTSVAFSPDGRYALSGSYDNTLKLWDVATGREIRTFKGHSNWVTSVAFSADGRSALSAAAFTMKLWDITTGIRIHTYKGHDNYVTSVAFSPDGRYALSGSYDKTLKLWNISTGKEIRTFKGHSDTVNAVAFSPDGQYALSSGDESGLKLWEVDTGKDTRTIKDHLSYVRSVAFSPDGRYALSGGSDGTLKLLDITTGKKIRTFEDHYDVFSVAFSLDGRYALSGSLDKTLKLWEVTTGKDIRTFKGHSACVWSVAFSPNGRYALSGSFDHTLKLWELTTGDCTRTFKEHSHWVTSVTYSPDGRYALSGSFDTTTRLWNIKTGKEITQMVSFDDGEWITITPEGYYNASVNGGKHLNVRIGNNVYAIDQYEATYFRPDIVKLALKLGDTQAAIAQLQKRAKPVAMAKAQPPKIWFVSPSANYETAKGYIDVTVKTEDIADTAESVTFKVNFRPLAKAKVPVRPVSVGAKIREFSKQIPLKIGENWIEAEVKGLHGATRNTTILVFRKGKVKKLPVLYYFGAGVAKHSIGDLALKFPDKDVTGLAEVLEGQKGKVYRDVKTKILVNQEASRASIIDEAEAFFQNAAQEDVAIFFISGHGMNNTAGEYHFIAYDTDPEKLSSTGVSWKFYNGLLKKIKSSILLFSDTCHSGNITGNAQWRKRANIDPNEFLRESARAGVFVFSSSSGDTVSREDPSWGHGAFAKALIDGLQGEAAYKKGMVKLSFLQDYVRDAVMELTENTQQPVIPKLGGQGAFLDLVLARK